MAFVKEKVLPTNDKRSPFYNNLPPYDSKPIDHLVEYFKYWKYFIKSLNYYFREILLVKEFEANLSSQLINTVQFPGFKDLPSKVSHEITHQLASKSPATSGTSTPTKEDSASSTPISRPPMHREKSAGSLLTKAEKNTPFLKNHKRGKLYEPVMSMAPTAPANNNDLNIPKSYFSGDSLFCNTGPMLLQHHSAVCTSLAKLSRDLKGRLIPRIDQLQKNLSSKIKEIKMLLRNELFANTDMAAEISKTGVVVADYMLLVERYNCPKPVCNPKYMTGYDSRADSTDYEGEDLAAIDDPFLVRIRVDYQIKKQLTVENYKFALYVNLQLISRDLYMYIIKDLLAVVERFGKLEFLSDIYNFFHEKLKVQGEHDWEHFISHCIAFVNTYEGTPNNPHRESRMFKEISIPYGDSIHSKCLRMGPMYRKLKMLKNYTKFYYVLSANYLHEFREEDWKLPGATSSKNGKPGKKKKNEFGITHNDVPAKLYNLNEYQISSKGDDKFVLSKRGKGLSKTTFKCMDPQDYAAWYSDLSELLRFDDNHLERFAMIEGMCAARDAEKHRRERMRLDAGALKEQLGVLGEMFDPQVATPRIQLPEEEATNPFEMTLAPQEVSVALSASTDPGYANFLKMQQDAMKLHLGEKVSERLSAKEVPFQITMPLSPQPAVVNQLHTPKGSSDLLKLMLSMHTPDVGKILATQDTNNHATFTLEDEADSSGTAGTPGTVRSLERVGTALPLPTLSVSHHE